MTDSTLRLVDTTTGEAVPGPSVLALPGPASKVALRLPESLTFDEWVEYGRTLGRIAEGVMWWVGDWWRFGERRYGERAAQALDSETFAFQTFADAGWVAGKIETSRRREVLSWSHHREVAALEPREQDELLDLAERDALSTRDLRQEVRRRRTEIRIGQAVADAGPLAALGRYPVLYADPPWRYEDAEPSRAVENNYPTMSLDDICALSGDLPATDDAVLFLWATSPKLAESLEVLDAWGFQYRTCLVWVKDRIGMGYYARQQHELLLVAKRGDLPVPAPENRPSSVLAAARGEHSAKPEEFYTLIESMYPDLPKVELFARSHRDGWAAWGNQAVAA